MRADRDKVVLGPLGPATLDALRGLGDEPLAGAVEISVISELPVPTPLRGELGLVGDSILFEPRYPFVPGVAYRIVIKPAAREWAFDIAPTRTKPRARLLVTYPSADVLPENVMKIYLHFSDPMSRGDVYQYVHLLNDVGTEVALPFLELEQGLWNAKGTRFTLLFDPGRIKRGLTPRMEVGTAIAAGRSYLLVVDAAWPDAEGLPLVSGVVKSFTAGPADSKQPDVRAWTLQPPRSGTRTALVVMLDEPLDAALLQSAISVETAEGQVVDGAVTTDRAETVWLFTPDSAWSHQAHHLIVKATLEDLAANSIGKPFEVGRGTADADMRDVRLTFSTLR